MFQGLSGWHFIILLVLILLLFGAPKLPGLAKSLGQSMRIFRGEMDQMKSERKADDGATAADAGASSATGVPAPADAERTAAERAAADRTAAERAAADPGADDAGARR